MKEERINAAQQIMATGQAPQALKTGREAAQQQTSMADVFDAVARHAEKTTIAQFHEGGATFIWVTKDEQDPVSALLHAAISILVHRGQRDGRVTVRRLTELVAPGHEIAWQVSDDNGNVIASGYAANEQDASQKIAEAMKLPVQS